MPITDVSMLHRYVLNSFSYLLAPFCRVFFIMDWVYMLKMRVSITALVLLALTALPSLAEERDTLRCNGTVISIGSTAGEVLNWCSEPASGSQREVVTVNGNRRYRTIITNDVEDWIFNFGSNQFQYLITLKNGRVKRIQSLGYGY